MKRAPYGLCLVAYYSAATALGVLLDQHVISSEMSPLLFCALVVPFFMATKARCRDAGFACPGRMSLAVALIPPLGIWVARYRSPPPSRQSPYIATKIDADGIHAGVCPIGLV
jgi:hypothetical protein